MLKSIAFSVTSAFLISLGTSTAYAQLELDVETGAALSGYNKVRIPGEGGTFINFAKALEPTPTAFYRLRLSYTINEKHTITALFAPLTIRYNGTFGQELQFFGTNFAATQPLAVRYQFNSYRLTYRYNFPRTKRFQFGVGGTAKIRDAEVEVNGVTKTNVGFVPLINFRAEWFAKEKLSLVLRGDALVAPQGRAEDVLLAALFYPSRLVTLKLGYRILEGGADNDEVYNFSLIHYAVIGGIITF
ncbi:MAG: hypothetical protein WA960_11515 [Tunicatimonas sp.]